MSDHPDDERLARLEALEAAVRVCTRCPLSLTRRHAVPGEGPVDARLIFVGEGPGAVEDQTGRPFVGPAGQLLDELLASIGLTRADVYITNVVKCRPPGNRDPQPEEIAACKPYLGNQLRLTNPEIIVTLGRFAMERWLPDKKISRVHGQPFRVGQRLLVPMWHPAAALRHPEWRQQLEADFLRLPELIEQERQRPTLPPTDEDDSPLQQPLL